MSLPFSIQLLPVENISALTTDKNVLAAIRFASIASAEDTEKPLFSVGLPNLALSNIVEVWYSDTPVQTAIVDGIQLAWNDDILFGHMLLDEMQYEGTSSATKNAYRLILNTIQHLSYPCLLRVWNYLSAINEDQQGQRHYQAFCQGRQEILDDIADLSYVPPASTVIGTSCAGLQVYFIAARKPGLQLKNPRQADCFLYPRHYGPVRPAFSRAIVKPWQDSTHLYISGTASIVGYKKHHSSQVQLQVEETLNNIEALLQYRVDKLNPPINKLTDLTYLKVYLCDLFMLSVTEELLIRRYGRHLPPVIFLRGDVCHSDLFIEIEATYTLNDIDY
jgi:chorismate lyase/3-hydroxybenzoate synthase